MENNDLSQLVSRFKNGSERYHTSIVLNQTVKLLYRGADPIQVIDELVLELERSRAKFQDYVVKGPSPQYIVADEETINKLKAQHERQKENAG